MRVLNTFIKKKKHEIVFSNRIIPETKKYLVYTQG